MHKLYLDMDGVLADFNRGVKELCHMNQWIRDIVQRKRQILYGMQSEKYLISTIG